MTARALLLTAMTGLAFLAPDEAQAIVCAGPVPCGCTVSASTIPFGTYDPLSSVPLDSVGSINMTCSGSASAAATVTIELNAGSSGNIADRQLKAGARALHYNLYLDPARTRVWGNDGASSLMTPFATGLKTYTIYGRVAPLQRAGVGAYRDSITVTIVY